MTELSWKDHLTSLGLKKVLEYLDSDPDTNIEKILNWLIKIDKEDKYIGFQAKVVRKHLSDPNNNWNKLIKSLWTDIDDGVRKKLFVNFLLNATFLGGKRQQKMREKYDCNIPWAILFDPTTSCNLRCVGCWAADYPRNLNMDFATLDKIITQGKELGVYFYLYSGGEPLVRKKDIIKLGKKHDDCVFLAFTNGVLIDENFADGMLEIQNFVPAISVEGFEQDTDRRRGKGSYQSVLNAMEILKARKLPFGISCCYTSQNTEVIGSEQFIDEMIDKGAKFAWFFTYMPVGVDAVPELMVSAEQRKFMYRQIRAFRESKPIFTMDFWNDGEYVEGCIAGGRRYLHINANGDIEPCAFIHYSDSNIYNKTLLDALQSPLFKQYQANQPFNSNHLRPCPLLDNYGCLAKMVQKSGAQSTDLQKPEDVLVLSAKCKKAAENWAAVADDLWQEKQLERAL
ncbi:MAG: radical SAM protein [Peptococcaceae bacterium]|jgi:MoaA/NifB/PqqE/SkfB family radical SAM enzyme|nr:radical SAM protein [Peptococcaceae bacterium]